MKLRDYLILHKISQEEFSGILDLNVSYLSLLITGTKIPGRKTARKIEDVTNGEISAERLLSGDALGYDGPPKRVFKPRKKGEKKKKTKKRLARNTFSLI